MLFTHSNVTYQFKCSLPIYMLLTHLNVHYPFRCSLPI